MTATLATSTLTGTAAIRAVNAAVLDACDMLGIVPSSLTVMVNANDQVGGINVFVHTVDGLHALADHFGLPAATTLQGEDCILRKLHPSGAPYRWDSTVRVGGCALDTVNVFCDRPGTGTAAST